MIRSVMAELLRPQARQTVACAGRACIPLLPACGAFALLGARLADPSSLMLEMSLVAQLDIYRALFYAALPLLALLLWLPSPEERRCRTWILLPAALLAGAACYWLLSRAPYFTRPQLAHDNATRLAAALVSLNLAGLVWLHCGNRWTERGRKLVLCAVLLTDALLPMLVWSAYRARNAGRILGLIRLLPALALSATPLLPWIVRPLDVGRGQPALGVELKQISVEDCYQALVEQRSGALLLVADKRPALIRQAAPGRGSEMRLELGDYKGEPQAVGLDADSGRLILIDGWGGAMQVWDANSLNPLKQTALSWSNSQTRLCRTLWDPDSAMLAANCTFGSLLLCPDGATVRAVFGLDNGQSDLALDPQRGLIHVLSENPDQLLALDASSFRVLRRRTLSRDGDRLLLDAENNRLFVSFPAAGEVLVFSADTYEPRGMIRAFPGVRAMGLDRVRNRLFLSGFSPLIEIRSLEDFSLLDRLWGPSWMRWVEVDPGRDVAYFTTFGHGVWRLDLALAEKNSAERAWLRRDPFFALIARAGAAAERIIWANQESWPAPKVYRAVSLYQGDCPQERWYE